MSLDCGILCTLDDESRLNADGESDSDGAERL